MQTFYQQLIDEGEAGITRLIDERAQEGLTLDFKEKTDPSNGSFNDNDKRILAKALSAFSNSAGGVIVYGLNARPLNGSVDCVQPPPIPIADIERFRSEAVTLIGALLQPKHDGIEVEIIRTAAKPSSGYLIINVPRSERRPHRSEAKDQKQYFKRSGDGSYAMEHYDIEDAFRRKRLPEIKFEWTVEKDCETADGSMSYFFVLKISNPGMLTTKFPYFYLSDLDGAALCNSYIPSAKYTLQYEGKWLCFVGGADVVINPLTKSTVTRLNANIRQNVDGDVFMMSKKISFKFRFGCENFPMEEGAVVITKEDIAQTIRWK